MFNKYVLGVSIVLGKHPIPYRTRQLSPVAAKVVPGKLGVKIAGCTHYLKSPLFEVGFFFALF